MLKNVLRSFLFTKEWDLVVLQFVICHCNFVHIELLFCMHVCVCLWFLHVCICICICICISISICIYICMYVCIYICMYICICICICLHIYIYIYMTPEKNLNQNTDWSYCKWDKLQVTKQVTRQIIGSQETHHPLSCYFGSLRGTSGDLGSVPFTRNPSPVVGSLRVTSGHFGSLRITLGRWP